MISRRDRDALPEDNSATRAECVEAREAPGAADCQRDLWAHALSMMYVSMSVSRMVALSPIEVGIA